MSKEIENDGHQSDTILRIGYWARNSAIIYGLGCIFGGFDNSSGTGNYGKNFLNMAKNKVFIGIALLCGLATVLGPKRESQSAPSADNDVRTDRSNLDVHHNISGKTSFVAKLDDENIASRSDILSR